jgi:decaprenylphospho-beta-D-ribofuranose 2-oxidase
MQQASADPPTIASVASTLHGWGGGIGAPARLFRPDSVDGARAALELCRSAAGADRAGAIARGMGRSYGDAAQRAGGYVLDMTALNGFELDHSGEAVTAQAGASLGQLIAALLPAGWMLPVVPGTQHVTVAGAIASDIHGKNHGADGTFGQHVRALGLLSASGEVLEIGPDADPELFAATLGGMGLTGVILWARIALQRVSSATMAVDSDRVRDVDEAMSILSAPGARRYRVAWLDLLGGHPGRGIVTCAEHLPAGAQAGAGELRHKGTVRARVTVPPRWPGGLLRPSAIRAHNEVRFRASPRRERGKPESLGAHLFPLDVLDAWPRLYGRRGFLQYQLVVPYGQERVIHIVIERMRRARVPCFLAVLKDFGPQNGAPLSFPITGWTLALDLPRVAGVAPLLDSFDVLVAEAGGRVYLSKDARMRPEALRSMYPRLAEWQAVRDGIDPDGVWRSDLALRTGLVPGGER